MFLLTIFFLKVEVFAKDSKTEYTRENIVALPLDILDKIFPKDLFNKIKLLGCFRKSRVNKSYMNSIKTNTVIDVIEKLLK